MDLLIALCWGGFVGLDATSFPQAMYSRPIVASTMVGLLFGRPTEGALIGLFLELFALPVLPFGAAAYPESGTAAVAATAAYLSATPARDDILLLAAIVLALLASHVSGLSVRLLRVRNSRIGARMARAGGEDGAEARALERGHRTALVLDYVRAALATGAAMAVSLLVLMAIEGLAWRLPVRPLELALIAAAAVGGAAVWIFGQPRQRIRALVLGAVSGLVLVLLT